MEEENPSVFGAIYVAYIHLVKSWRLVCVFFFFFFFLLHYRPCAQLNVKLTTDKENKWRSNLKWFAAGFDAYLRNVNI